MDSRAVSRRFRQLLRPELEAAGFGAFTDRNAWLLGRDVTRVVNIQSFNDHTAYGVGCTTFSFSVNLGLHFAGDGPPRRADRPQEYECTLRFRLRKSVQQPYFHPYGRADKSDRPDVWYVKPDCSNLDEVVEDARSILIGEGLGTLERFGDPRAALDLLREMQESPSGRRTTAPHVDLGLVPRPGSPRWNEIIALLTSHLDPGRVS